MNPTWLGAFSVVWWGMAIPMSRIFQLEIGLLASNGISFAVMAALGFAYQKYRKTKWDKAIFKNPAFYWRGFFMSFHILCFSFAALMVQTKYVPLVILLNYFWPTAVILYSVLIAGVQVTRWPYFLTGLAIIIGALTVEIAGDLVLSSMGDLKPLDYISFAVVFIGANAWGIYSALSRKYGEETGAGTVIPFYQMALIPLLPAAFLVDPTVFSEPKSAFWILFLIGYSFFGFLAYVSWDLGMRKGNVIVLSLMADFIPWFSLFFAHMLLGVHIGDKTIVSAVMLVLGAMVTRYGTIGKGTSFFGKKIVSQEA